VNLQRCIAATLEPQKHSSPMCPLYRIGRPASTVVVMGRPLAALLLLCVCVPAVALAAGTDPKERITAADQAKARSIVVSRADFVGGWTRLPAAPESDEACPGFDPDNSDLTLTGQAQADFAHPDGFPKVLSSADVYVSRADASAAWTRNVKPAAAARCVAHVFRRDVEADGGNVTIVSHGPMAFPKVAPKTAAFRVVARLTLQKPGQQAARVPFTIRVVVMGKGRGIAVLMTAGFGEGVRISDLRLMAMMTAFRLAAAKV
jgi:hypothetical protein